MVRLVGQGIQDNRYRVIAVTTKLQDPTSLPLSPDRHVFLLYLYLDTDLSQSTSYKAFDDGSMLGQGQARCAIGGVRREGMAGDGKTDCCVLRRTIGMRLS